MRHKRSLLQHTGKDEVIGGKQVKMAGDSGTEKETRCTRV